MSSTDNLSLEIPLPISLSPNNKYPLAIFPKTTKLYHLGGIADPYRKHRHVAQQPYYLFQWPTVRYWGEFALLLVNLSSNRSKLYHSLYGVGTG
jgi:hypothetical protein